MSYEHWFVSRPKRRLTPILNALVVFSDVCVGEKWAGNNKLQIAFEDELGKREITMHGELRARKEKNGGGGARTLFKQMKDLGLIFTEDENKKCHLTLIGEELIKGNVSFVEAMRMQLKRYQYPSATTCSGSGKISFSFKVHPFQFIFRLLRDPRLENYLTMEEMYGIIIHQATSDSKEVFEKVINNIVKYRQGYEDGIFKKDTEKKKYSNIANTFFNYISLTQYIDRGYKMIKIRNGKESDVDAFIEKNPKFIDNPELTENYLRKYGRGNSSRDLRNFKNTKSLSRKEVEEERIRKEYVLLALKTPITSISRDVVEYISNHTGIDEKEVEQFLIKNYSKGNISDFFVAYKELANMGRTGARDFELATCEIFKKIFKMEVKHVGPMGNTPDVYVESKDYGFCGIIDNKSYKDTYYSISGNNKRSMEHVYIPYYDIYGDTEAPLAFFTYIARSFGKNIDSQIDDIKRNTEVNGSAMPVDLLITLAQDYVEKGYNHDDLKRIFSVNREVRLSDIIKP